MQQSISSINNNHHSALEVSGLERHSGFKGEFLHFFGRTVKVWNAQQKCFFYYEKNQLASSLVQQNVKLTSSQIDNICRKFIEIVHPFDSDALNITEFKKGYANFGHAAESYEKAMQRLETQKQCSAIFDQFFYDKNLMEVANVLQPGDIIVRKYHEDNPNPICTLQKVFRKRGFREAYKCSHIALYLGEKNGKNWIAEASLPHDNEPQIRRLQLDDPRFELKDKNQYLIIRNKNGDVAKEAARIADLYSLKMHPAAEVPSKNEDKEGAIKYNHFEALRSLWHSNSFDYVAKHRIFKYYADYSNAVPFQYVTDNRMLFCSEFALLAIQMAEVNKNSKFAKIINANKPPVSNENKYTSGIGKFFARISYVVRRAFWSRYMAVRFSKKIDKIIKTKVDFLRTSPQDTVNHLLTKNDNYEVVGMINKKVKHIGLTAKQM